MSQFIHLDKGEVIFPKVREYFRSNIIRRPRIRPRILYTDWVRIYPNVNPRKGVPHLSEKKSYIDYCCKIIYHYEVDTNNKAKFGGRVECKIGEFCSKYSFISSLVRKRDAKKDLIKLCL